MLNPKAWSRWVAKSAGTATDGSTVWVGAMDPCSVAVGEGVTVGVNVGVAVAVDVADGSAVASGVSVAGRSHAASIIRTETASAPDSFINEISYLRASGHSNTVS